MALPKQSCFESIESERLPKRTIVALEKMLGSEGHHRQR